MSAPHDFAAGPGGFCGVCGRHPRIHDEDPAELYGGGAPAVAGSETSQAAAVSILPVRGRLQAQVLRVVEEAEPWGVTCDEVEARLGGRHQSISARVRELAVMHAIYDSGEKRRTRSGRMAVVYKLMRGPDE